MINPKVDVAKYDVEKLGLKVGIELHQQLDTSRKLFCSCPTRLTDEDVGAVFLRQLRPTRSELGEVDVAALFEWQRGRLFEYHSPISASCLVEDDEEPPHSLNREAVIIALAMAKAFGSLVVDEVHVMRKIVIDGSNTTGFQRTAIVALGGSLNIGRKKIGIQSIAVEEDAARKIEEKGKQVIYKLDRLGIPLIEISTEPDMKTPEEVYETALTIGLMLRLTGKVKRGLGTVRQDLNVSITGGVRTEIKGVQRLDLLPKIVLYEAIRQARLLEIRDELRQRGVKEEDVLSVEIIDVTRVFEKTSSKLIKRVVRNGGVVLAIRLPKFKGLLGAEVQPGRRFGTELADYARFWGGVGGLFHSDELPKYGISEKEVNEVYRLLRADPEEDAFVLIADQYDKAYRAIKAVLVRAAYAVKGIPRETRAALEDGTTRYSRPQPGAARMYPETDIPPLEVTEELLREAEKIKPASPQEKMQELVKKYSLSIDLARQLIRSHYLDLFEELASKYTNVQPSIVASMLTSVLRALRREGIEVERIPEKAFEEITAAISEGKISKDVIPEILAEIASKPNTSPTEVVKKYYSPLITESELEELIDSAIAELRKEIEEKGERALNKVMGLVMPKLRGKVDGRRVAEIARKKIKELLESRK